MTTLPERIASALAPKPKPPSDVTRDNFDFEAAHQEGWTLSNYGTYKDGTPHVELQRLDKLKVEDGGFSSDLDAWIHVVNRARQHSALHLAALSLIDRHEKLGIETHCGTW